MPYCFMVLRRGSFIQVNAHTVRNANKPLPENWYGFIFSKSNNNYYNV